MTTPGGFNLTKAVTDHAPQEAAALRAEREAAVARLLDINRQLAHLETVMLVTQTAVV